MAEHTVKNWFQLLLYHIRDFNSYSTGECLAQIGATNYQAQLGSPDKCRAIIEVFVGFYLT